METFQKPNQPKTQDHYDASNRSPTSVSRGILLIISVIIFLVVLGVSISRADPIPTLDATAPLTTDATAMPETQVEVWGVKHTLVWTFDDHPSRWTDETLAVLKQHRITATFFVVAYPLWSFYQSPSYKPSQTFLLQTRRIAFSGHRIGGHSLTHRRLCSLPARDLRVYEFDRSQAVLRRVLGVAPKLWRPPHGEYCRNVWTEIKRLSLTSVLWDLADYHTTAPRMLTLLKRRVQAGRTKTVVLFHPHHNQLLQQFLSLLASVRAQQL